MRKEVLFCDDESQILHAAEFKLRRVGFHVRRARNSEEAWNAIQARRPDLVVTDCQMSHLGGKQLIERIRSDERTATLPLLVLTVANDVALEEMAVSVHRTTHVLYKPFSPRELCQRIQQALEKAPVPQPLLGHSPALAVPSVSAIH